MFYAIVVSPSCELPDGEEAPSCVEELVFEDIKEASKALKHFKGSRMKTFNTRERAVDFLNNPGLDESFIDLDSSCQDIVSSLEKLSLLQPSPQKDHQQRQQQQLVQHQLRQSPSSPKPQTQQQQQQSHNNQTQPQETSSPKVQEPGLLPAEEPVEYKSVQPATLNLLRRKIETGDYESVHEMIWANPRCLVTVCDSAIYLMAGPKYNACHIAARANKPDIMALILDTITNFKFLRKLYPEESTERIQVRVNHLVDSYLNTRDPRLGNTPLHFACKSGHYKVVRVLLTFEGCDLTLRDSSGKTAEESICAQNGKISGDNEDSEVKRKIKSMFKHQLHLPLFRDQLKKRLLLERRRSIVSSQKDSDTSFSDLDDSIYFS